jgi:hypothetical protein
MQACVVTGLVEDVPAGAAGLAAVLALLTILVVHELLVPAEAPWAARVDRILRILAIPLTILFLGILAARILQILR